eukprot:111102-Pelagomonas_calceolata.AAC.1
MCFHSCTADCATCKSQSGLRDLKGKGYITVPAYVGSLAEAKTVPVTKPVRGGKQERNILVTAFQAL